MFDPDIADGLTPPLYMAIHDNGRFHGWDTALEQRAALMDARLHDDTRERDRGSFQRDRGVDFKTARRGDAGNDNATAHRRLSISIGSGSGVIERWLRRWLRRLPKLPPCR